MRVVVAVGMVVIVVMVVTVIVRMAVAVIVMMVVVVVVVVTVTVIVVMMVVGGVTIGCGRGFDLDRVRLAGTANFQVSRGDSAAIDPVDHQSHWIVSDERVEPSLKLGRIDTEVDQGSEHHVAGNSAERIEMKVRRHR